MSGKTRRAHQAANIVVKLSSLLCEWRPGPPTGVGAVPTWHFLVCARTDLTLAQLLNPTRLFPRFLPSPAECPPRLSPCHRGRKKHSTLVCSRPRRSACRTEESVGGQGRRPQSCQGGVRAAGRGDWVGMPRLLSVLVSFLFCRPRPAAAGCYCRHVV